MDAFPNLLTFPNLCAFSIISDKCVTQALGIARDSVVWTASLADAMMDLAGEEAL